MSDSIQPVRYTPQINRHNPKARTGDKKDKQDKHGSQGHMPANDNDQKVKGHNKREETQQNPEHVKQEDDNPSQIEDECGLDESCGTILDSEV